MNQKEIPGDDFAFYQSLFQLKNLYRQGWLHSGIDREVCESIADHSFALAMLCLKYEKEYPLALDTEKMIKMALIHDLAESIIGDFIPAENISTEDKFIQEKQAIQSVLSHFPDSEGLCEIWLEFEAGDTPTGAYVKQMDKIEMLLQALVYQQNKNVDLSSFFVSTESQMKNEFFQSLRMTILKSAGFES